MSTPEETQTVEQPSLSLQDLITVINIIQLMNKRGAIQASEMSMVGGVYDRFMKFLEANGAVDKKPYAQPMENTNA